MSSSKPAFHLTSGRLLARNTLWNLLGQLLPMAVGVAAVPPIVHGMGVERFGVLSLAWIVIGYFSLFDLGLGRALTKLVADKLGAHEEGAIPPLAWTSLLLMLLLGLAGGLATAALSGWLVQKALKIPPALETETLHSFYLLAFSIPIITATSGLRGILEALQRFRILNVIRVPMSIFSWAGPLLVLPFSHSLFPVVAVLAAGRFIGCAAHLLACLHALPALRHNVTLNRALIAPVLRFGGWMTVTNIVGPLMVYLDRFLVGGLLSVGAVAYYTAPFDMVSRLLVIPAAVTGVLFPAFAVSLALDSERTGLLVSRGIKYVFLAIFPVALTIVALAPELLRLWLGADFAAQGSAVLQWLAAGVFINCLAQIPFTLIQSAGRPDITAKLHLLELPLYLLALRLLVKAHGIEGAAMAWTGRVIFDAALLFFFAHLRLPQGRKFLPKLGIAAAAALLVFYASAQPVSLPFKSCLLGLLLFFFMAASWFWALAPEERALMARFGARWPVKGESVSAP